MSAERSAANFDESGATVPVGEPGRKAANRVDGSGQSRSAPSLPGSPTTSAATRPEIKRVEWVPLYQVPPEDAWHEWNVGTVRRYESQARQLVKDLAVEYPHYKWKLVKVTTTEELFDV